MLGSLTFYLFFPTRLINSIKHEHSCKILYIKIKRIDAWLGFTLFAIPPYFLHIWRAYSMDMFSFMIYEPVHVISNNVAF